MKRRKKTSFLLIGILNIILLFYMSVTLERVIYDKLNDYNIELEVIMSDDDYSAFTSYIDNANLDVEFYAFKNNNYTLFTSNNVNPGCYKQNHFGYSNQYIECELEQSDSSKLRITYTNEVSYNQVVNFLNTNNISYEELYISAFSNSSIFDYFVIITIIIYLLMVYLSNFDNLDEVMVKYINGWSKKRIVLESYIKYFIDFTIMGTMVSLFSIVLLKVKFSELSYVLFVENVLFKYVLALLIINILIILLIAISVYSVLSIKKNNRNSYQKIVVSYIMKTILYITTMSVSSLCYMQVVNYNIDKNNLSNYEKFDNYSGYQLSEEQIINTLKENNDYVYYTSSSPSVLDEAYEVYCEDDYKNIVYCKSIVGSSSFFEIATNNKFENNSVVIPYKYKEYENDIVNDINIEYPGLDFEILYYDNTDIYSYSYYYSNETNDYISDAVWLVYAQYHESLYNINTIYSIEDMGGDVYKFDNFSTEFRLYLESTKNQVVSLLVLMILQVILFVFLNNIIIRSTINNKLQVIASQITNGFSYYDIFYVHYTHIIVVSVVSTIASSYIINELIPINIPLTIGIILFSGEIILNEFLIRRIVKSKITKYLKGDKI